MSSLRTPKILVPFCVLRWPPTTLGNSLFSNVWNFFASNFSSFIRQVTLWKSEKIYWIKNNNKQTYEKPTNKQKKSFRRGTKQPEPCFSKPRLKIQEIFLLFKRWSTDCVTPYFAKPSTCIAFVTPGYFDMSIHNTLSFVWMSLSAKCRPVVDEGLFFCVRFFVF